MFGGMNLRTKVLILHPKNSIFMKTVFSSRQKRMHFLCEHCRFMLKKAGLLEQNKEQYNNYGRSY
jgi:hypothetical protein